MTFFSMLSKVEAEEAKKQVASSDAAASADPAPAKKKTKKIKETLPEGSEADNVLQEDEPEADDETEE